jgi:hypothetical protein
MAGRPTYVHACVKTSLGLARHNPVNEHVCTWFERSSAAAAASPVNAAKAVRANAVDAADGAGTGRDSAACWRG